METLLFNSRNLLLGKAGRKLPVRKNKQILSNSMMSQERSTELEKVAGG